jgi:CMP-N,N'-diacetyllegionaminic acid synthase
MNVLALITARSGSKSMPDKNILPIQGKPMLAYSIEHARAARRVTRTIVSTDSPRYAEIARGFGAEVPFLRPAELAGDETPDLPVFLHALEWLQREEGYRPDLVVHLRPTCPLRRAGLIDAAIVALQQDPEADSVRTVTRVTHPPYKMWTLGGDGRLRPLLSVEGIPEPWNEPRQRLPQAYLQTANVDVVRYGTLVEQRSMTGRRILPLVEEEFCDIDTPGEFLEAEDAVRIRCLADSIAGGGSARYTLCFDMDGVIATLVPGNDYEQARPIGAVIDLINALQAAGHRIIVFTARGYVTGIDWGTITLRQLQEWGVRYDELKFGKPAADFYVDDRALGHRELRLLIAECARRGKGTGTMEVLP